MKAVDVAEKADPSGFILAREERTRLLLRTQRLSDLLRAEDLDVAWYIDAMREPEHIEYAKVFLQTVRKTLSGEIQRFPGSCTAPAPGLDRFSTVEISVGIKVDAIIDCPGPFPGSWVAHVFHQHPLRAAP